MLIRKRDSALHLRSFWQIQIVGWGCFFLYDLLSSILALLGNRDPPIRSERVSVHFKCLRGRSGAV
jgi:hypothetical protein